MSLDPIDFSGRPKRSGTLMLHDLPTRVELSLPPVTPAAIAVVDEALARDQIRKELEAVAIGRLEVDETTGAWCWQNPYVRFRKEDYDI